MENDNDKTLWKKNLFSDNQVPKDDDFQTLNMIHKIKKVNSKKEKRKKSFNYKNISTFENIHEQSMKEPIVDGSQSRHFTQNGTLIDESGKKGTVIIDYDSGKYYVKDDSGKKLEYKGPMDPDSNIPLTSDFWEGLDSGDKGLSADDPRLRFLAFIQSIEDWIENFNQKMAEYVVYGLQQAVPIPINTIVTKDSNILILKKSKDKLTNQINKEIFRGVSVKKGFAVTGRGIPSTSKRRVTILSVGKDNTQVTMSDVGTESGEFVLEYYDSPVDQQDVAVVRKHLFLFFTTIIAYIFAYNLVFVTLCEKDGVKSVKLMGSLSDQLKNTTLNEDIGPAAEGTDFLLRYAVYFPDFFQKYFLHKIPLFFKTYLNAPFFFMAAFAVTIYATNNLMSYFLQLLRDIIMLNTENTTVNIMYFLVIFFFLYECIHYYYPGAKNYSVAHGIQMISNPPLTLLMGIFQFIIILFISAPLGAILCLILFIVISTAMIWHPIVTLNPDNIVDILYIPYYILMGIGPIYEFLRKSFKTSFSLKDEQNLTTVQRVEFYFIVFCDFICSNMFVITTLVLMGISLTDYQNLLRNPLLKNNITRFTGFVMLATIGFLIVQLNTKVSENREATKEELAQEAVSEETGDNTKENSSGDEMGALGLSSLAPPGVSALLSNPEEIAKGALGEKLGNIPGLSDASALLSDPSGMAKGALGEKLGNIPGLSDASALLSNPEGMAKGNIPGLSDASAILSNPEGMAKGNIPGLSDASALSSNPEGMAKGNIPGLSDASAIGKDLTNITGPAGDMIKKGDLSAIGDGDASIALKKMPDNNRAIAKEGEPDQINSSSSSSSTSSGENIDQQNNVLSKDVNGIANSESTDSNADLSTASNTIQNNGNARAESNGNSTCEITGELKIKNSGNTSNINGNVTNNVIPKTNPPNMYQIIDDNNTKNTTDNIKK